MHEEQPVSQIETTDFSLAVLNPGGHDQGQSFHGGAGEPTSTAHAPINFHAYAACVNGSFCRETQAALDTSYPVLLLLRRNLVLCLKTLKKLQAAGRKVAISLKETGAHQIVELLSDSRNLSLFGMIVERADGCLATTPFSTSIYRAWRPKAPPETVEFIPTPYPVGDPRWDFSCSLEERTGIWLGTREFKVPTRNHLASIMILKTLVERLDTHLDLINVDGRLGRKLLQALNFPKKHLRVTEARMPYPKYLKFLSTHRCVFQLDQSRVPGQVTGDALLCHLPCVGGNGTIDRAAYPQFCLTDQAPEAILDQLEKLMTDDSFYTEQIALGQKNAAQSISFPIIAKRLEQFFNRL